MAGFLEQFDKAPVEKRWPMVRQWIVDRSLPAYAELREKRPILTMPEMTIATRFDDCTAILRRFEAFTVALYEPKQGAYWMAQDDTAIHWREKSIMKAILDREDIPKIRKYIADKTMALLKQAGNKIDAVDDLARAVPVALVQDWFGFTDSNPKHLADWSYWNQYDAFHNQPFDSIVVPDQKEVEKHRKAVDLFMVAYIALLVEKRVIQDKLGKHGADPVSRLVRLSQSGAVQFDTKRVILNVGGLLIGAVETTSNAVINALSTLLAQPAQLAKARAAATKDDPAEFDGYVWEALRFAPAFPYFFRTCAQPSVLAAGTAFETEIKPGTTVLALTHSAMFDPTAFPNPNTFDPARSRADTFHLGYGLHECLGRAIAEVMIPEIVRQCLRMTNLRADAPVVTRDGFVPTAYPLHWGN
jgi:cytochrome P450